MNKFHNENKTGKKVQHQTVWRKIWRNYERFIDFYIFSPTLVHCCCWFLTLSMNKKITKSIETFVRCNFLYVSVPLSLSLSLCASLKSSVLPVHINYHFNVLLLSVYRFYLDGLEFFPFYNLHNKQKENNKIAWNRFRCFRKNIIDNCVLSFKTKKNIENFSLSSFVLNNLK